MVIHANHPAEIDDAVASGAGAIGRCRHAGAQSSGAAARRERLDTLAELCERLVDLRVMPYYLHQLDRVAGAAHFEVPVARGRR